jgi:hypothetical protein
LRKEAWRQNAQECTEILTNKATPYIIGSGWKALCIIGGRRKKQCLIGDNKKRRRVIGGAWRRQGIGGSVKEKLLYYRRRFVH